MTENDTVTVTVYVVTFESPGSGGFDWFYKPEDADKDYQEQQVTYADFQERTEVARFDVEIPVEYVLGCVIQEKTPEKRQEAITKWLQTNDVYGKGDQAEQRVIVNRRI
jgi:hypothetical protein